MSGIAEVLVNLGFRVSGSDAKRSNVTDRLQQMGVEFAEGHDGEHVGDAHVVVRSTAVREDNPEIVESIQLLAETEGIFTETAGGVTVGCARKLYKSDRILPDETTVLCITGNGLKTTDVLSGEYEAEEPIAPKLAEFEKVLAGEFELPAAVGA